MSIALLGVTGFRNRGVEALAVPVVNTLLERPGVEPIRIFSWSAEHDQHRLQDERLVFVPTSFRRNSIATGRSSRRERLKQWLKGGRNGQGAGALRAGLVDPQLVAQLQGSRLAVISGGDVYSSEYGHDSLLYYCCLVHSAKAAGLAVVLLGHTVGRFNSEADEKAWRACAAKIDLLTTRDQLTYDYLRQIDALAGKTEVCADVAFGLQPAAQAPASGFADPSRPCVALSISRGLHRWCALSADGHRLAWLELILHMLADWQVNVMLIPHVQESYGDDRQLATDLHRATNFDPRLWVAAEDLSASEYKRLISDCDLVVAERMHAAIAGLSTRVPTVMVSYSLKVEGIASLAYADLASGATSMVIEANTLQEPALVIEKLSRAWQDRKTVQRCLAGSIPAIQTLANQNFVHLGALMDELGLQ